MKICDICKIKQPAYDTAVIVDDNGDFKSIELCSKCYLEFRYREDRARHQAYEETVKTVTGEIPRKSHWWDMFGW